MNKRRLLKLADLLEADAKKKRGIQFDWLNWGSIADEKKPMSCGTQACALGLAAISGKFKRAGLGYRLDTFTNRIAITFNGRGSNRGAFRTGQRVFDLTARESDFLFSPRFNDPQEGREAELCAARRIRDFVAGRVTAW